MRMSDWSSDVCSSDLAVCAGRGCGRRVWAPRRAAARVPVHRRRRRDRKSVVEGKSVSVRVDLGGRRILTKKDERAATHSLVYNSDIHSKLTTACVSIVEMVVQYRRMLLISFIY